MILLSNKEEQWCRKHLREKTTQPSEKALFGLGGVDATLSFFILALTDEVDIKMK